MGRPRLNQANQVVAKEAIVITVGAVPPEFHKQTVRNRRTDQLEEVELNEFDPKDPGDLGTAYSFKAGQRVPAGHPAVKDCPDAFVSLDEAEDLGLEPVRA